MRIFKGMATAYNQERGFKAIWRCDRTLEVAFGDFDDLPERPDGWREMTQREFDERADMVFKPGP